MSIKEKAKNEKYEITVFLGRDGNKKRNYYETFHGGKREARLRESELKKLALNGNLVENHNITMTELVDEWLESKRNNVGIKTFVEYTRYCNNIKKCMGHIKIKNINVKKLFF